MTHEEKYIYGIILSDSPRNFGYIGIRGPEDEVTTIQSKGLAAIVSNIAPGDHTLAPQTLKAHAKVIETAMESHDVLPLRFGTVAKSQKEIERFLDRAATPLKKTLRAIKGRVEIDIKVFWNDLPSIFSEIGEQDTKIRALKAGSKCVTRQTMILAGQLVCEALAAKKNLEATRYIKPLKQTAEDVRELNTPTDDLVAHATFLVEKQRLKKFDSAVEKMEEEFRRRIRVHYLGPMAPVSFFELKVHWESGP